MATKINKAKRLHLLDLLGPPLLFALYEACDQTIVFLAEDGSVTTVHRETKLFTRREDAVKVIRDHDSDMEESLEKSLLETEIFQGAHKWARQQLALPRKRRYGRRFLEEVRGEASFKARPDTW